MPCLWSCRGRTSCPRGFPKANRCSLQSHHFSQPQRYGTKSYSNLRFDGWMGIIVKQFKILEVKGKDIFDLGIDLQLRQRFRFATKQQARLIQMITVEMRVAQGVDEFSGLIATDLRHHL